MIHFDPIGVAATTGSEPKNSYGSLSSKEMQLKGRSIWEGERKTVPAIPL